MNRIRMLKFGIIGLGAALVFMFVAVLALDFYVRSTLNGLGFEYAKVERNGLDWRIRPLQHPSFTANEARLRLGTTQRFDLRGATIDLAALDTQPLPAIPGWLYVSGDPVTLNWGQRTLASGLRVRIDSGQLVGTGPSLRVRGPVQGNTATLDIEGDLSFDWLSFTGKGRLTVANPARLSVEMPILRVSAADLGKVPLELSGATFELEGTRRQAEGAFTFGGASGTLALGCAESNTPCLLDYALPDADFGALVGQLRGLLPRQAGAKVKGVINVQGQLDLATGTATTAISLRDLKVQGSGIKSAQYRDFFYYKAPGASGNPEEIEAGPGSASWTPVADMAPELVAAIDAVAQQLETPGAGLGLGGLKVVFTAPADGTTGGPSVFARHFVERLLVDARDPAAARALQGLLQAAELEAALGPEAMRDLYLNIVPWAPGVHGVRAATEHFFETKPDAVDARQAAFLMALLPDPLPHYQAWFKRGKPDKERLAAVIEAMRARGALTAAQASDALATRLSFE